MLLRVRNYWCLALILVTTTSFADSKPAGVSLLSDVDQSTNRQLELTLWYPTDSMESSKPIGANAVFLGAEGIVDARPASSPEPLILISHGGLRSAANSGAWFAQRLAQEGFITVEINATRPFSPTDALNEIWQRPSDMSRALDILLAHPEWSQLINKHKIASIGFYLGGTASMMLSDTRLNETDLRATCDDEKQNSDCAWFKANDISLTEAYLKPMPKNLRDSRISHYIGIEPEYLHAFPINDITARLANVNILFLDKESVSSENNGVGTYIANANRFDGFSLCKPLGASIIAGDGGDPRICSDRTLERNKIHDEIVETVLGVFTEGKHSTELE